GMSRRETNCVNSCAIVKHPVRIMELDDRLANPASETKKPFDNLLEGRFLKTSGEGGIRTRGGCDTTRHFQCRTFGLSVTSPISSEVHAILGFTLAGLPPDSVPISVV